MIPIWEFEVAVQLAKSVEHVLSGVGFHVAIGGGVLRRGWSTKDLDLIIYPHSSAHNDRRRVVRVLRAMGWTRTKKYSEMWKFWAEKGSDDRKIVEVWRDHLGRRVDLIYFSDEVVYIA